MTVSEIGYLLRRDTRLLGTRVAEARHEIPWNSFNKASATCLHCVLLLRSAAATPMEVSTHQMASTHPIKNESESTRYLRHTFSGGG